MSDGKQQNDDKGNRRRKRKTGGKQRMEALKTRLQDEDAETAAAFNSSHPGEM